MTSVYNINNIGTFYPIGALHIFANTITGNNSISGWLYCDGSAISRTTYNNLFNVIGTTYGVGDGSSTFNIPDFRNYYAQGNPISYLTNLISVEVNSKYLTNNNLPSHSHSGTTAAAGGHKHNFTSKAQRTNDVRGGFSNVYLNYYTTGPPKDSTMTTEVSASFAHTHNTNTTSSAYGNGSGANVLDVTPPYVTMLFIIKY